jgi:hypothetical protein
MFFLMECWSWSPATFAAQWCSELHSTPSYRKHWGLSQSVVRDRGQNWLKLWCKGKLLWPNLLNPTLETSRMRSMIPGNMEEVLPLSQPQTSCREMESNSTGHWVGGNLKSRAPNWSWVFISFKLHKLAGRFTRSFVATFLFQYLPTSHWNLSCPTTVLRQIDIWAKCEQQC